MGHDPRSSAQSAFAVALQVAAVDHLTQESPMTPRSFCTGIMLAAAACASPQPPGVLSPTSAAWIDVTATLDPATTPVYEGDAPMRFDFLKDMRRGDALTLSAYSLGAHSGTHVDAPMHFVAAGAPVDRVPLAPLIGPARVIQIGD
jgi:hypothetical protein